MWDMSAPATVSERHVLRGLVPSEPLPPGPLDDVGNVSGALMLPSPDDQPSVPAEAFLRAAVPGDVRVEFGPPPLGVCLRGHGVIGASVPEAAVDEDRDAGPGQGNVGPAGQCPHVDAVTKPSPMQFPAEGEFRLGSRRPQSRHEAADRRSRCGGFVRNG